MRTLVSPSGRVEVKWPWILGGRWQIIIEGSRLLHGVRWPGRRRARWLLWGLDVVAQGLRANPAKLMVAEEVEQLSKEVGKPNRKPRGYLEGTPATDAAFDRAKALGWSERSD